MRTYYPNTKTSVFIIRVCETCKYANATLTELSCTNSDSKYYCKCTPEGTTCNCWYNDNCKP